MRELPDLSVIIVNWNSADFVRKCLISLSQQTQDLKIEIIVIDNASWDGCGEMIASVFPDVHFIQSGANLGFGRANNMAFQHSRGSFVLFLNPDTEALDGAIPRLLSVLHTKADAGIVGAKLLNSDGSIQTSCVQRFPSMLGVLLDSDLLRTLLPRWSLWGMRPLFDNPSAEVSVDAVSGACQMLRRDVFQRAGMYNPAYFMYAEDIDLCFRTTQLGLKNYYVPDAGVIHHGGKSSSGATESGRSAILMRESWKRFFEQHRGPAYALMFRIAVGVQAALRVVLLLFPALVAGLLGLHGRLAMLRRKWTRILRWALGLEPWVNRLPSR